jgi:hypothetical protein
MLVKWIKVKFEIESQASFNNVQHQVKFEFFDNSLGQVWLSNPQTLQATKQNSNPIDSPRPAPSSLPTNCSIKHTDSLYDAITFFHSHNFPTLIFMTSWHFKLKCLRDCREMESRRAQACSCQPFKRLFNLFVPTRRLIAIYEISSATDMATEKLNAYNLPTRACSPSPEHSYLSSEG